MADLVTKARETALQVLQGLQRSDGSPFIGHPDAVARIVDDELGLPDECVAAVYLHEASIAQSTAAAIQNEKPQ